MLTFFLVYTTGALSGALWLMSINMFRNDPQAAWAMTIGWFMWIPFALFLATLAKLWEAVRWIEGRLVK